jgi:hypothetical protein
MKIIAVFVLFICLGSELFAVPCNPGDQLWISKGKLFYGKKMISDDKSPVILKPSKTCKKLFPFCSPNAAFAKTKKRVFYLDKEVKGADPASFEYVCDDYGKDKKKVYKQESKFSSSEAKTFELQLDFGIYKTAKKIYTRAGKAIAGADPKTLKAIQHNKRPLLDYIQDKNAVYHLWGVKLKLNPKKLKTYGLEYLGDDRRVYFRTKQIEHADPETFKVTNAEKHLSEDKTNTYLEEKLLKPK